MITVVETPTFFKDVKCAGLNEEEHMELVNFPVSNPEAGVVMKGTGGARKVRFAVKGRGKSGAYRVICYFHREDVPLFVLALFAKSGKANLAKAERNELKALMPQIVEVYKARKM